METDAQELMRRFDLDGDGMLNPRELAALLNEVLVGIVMGMLSSKRRPLVCTFSRADTPAQLLAAAQYFVLDASAAAHAAAAAACACADAAASVTLDAALAQSMVAVPEPRYRSAVVLPPRSPSAEGRAGPTVMLASAQSV